MKFVQDPNKEAKKFSAGTNYYNMVHANKFPGYQPLMYNSEGLTIDMNKEFIIDSRIKVVQNFI